MTDDPTAALRDASTNPEALRAAERTHPALVAANPSTPMEVLKRLAITHPGIVVRNPAFRLALATEPDFLGHTGDDPLGALVQQPEAPQALWYAAARRNNTQVAAHLLANPKLTPEFLTYLLEDGGPAAGLQYGQLDNHCAMALDPDPRAPDRIFSEFMQRSAPEPGVLVDWANTGLTLHHGLRPLLADEATAHWGPIIAASPLTHPDLLGDLAGSSSARLRHAVAANPRTRPDVVARLAHDEAESVRLAAIGNPALPERLHAEAAHDGPRVRAALAGNPALSAAARAAFAKVRDTSILHALVRNPRLDEPSLLLIARTANVVLLRELLERPDLTPPILAVVEARVTGLLLTRARQYQPLAGAAVDPRDQLARVLRQPFTPLGAQALLATSGGLGEMAEILLNHPNPMVRLALALYGDISALPAHRLQQDADLRVRRAARLRALHAAGEPQGT